MLASQTMEQRTQWKWWTKFWKLLYRKEREHVENKDDLIFLPGSL